MVWYGGDGVVWCGGDGVVSGGDGVVWLVVVMVWCG